MSKNDELIKKLIAEIKKKREELGTKPRNVLITNGLFKNSEGHMQITAVSDPQELIRAYAFLLEKMEYCEKASKELGFAVEKFIWDGYAIDEWKEDFKLQISSIYYRNKKKDLDAAEKRLQSLMSEEAKTEAELEKLKESLGISI